jgi:uncharacterized membrane protein YuzA (DUF378 family)
MKYLKHIAFILLLIGGLNWGIYGLAGFDLVEVLFGGVPVIARLVYVLVGLSAVYIILNKYVLCGGSGRCECVYVEKSSETTETLK